jgi:HEPN domain-containing protein
LGRISDRRLKVRRQKEEELSRRPKRVFKTAEGYRSSDLAQFGWDHLYAARILFQTGGIPCLDSAGYLAQLGLELLLKALLLEIDGEFPEEHSLQELWRMVQAKRLGLQLQQAHADVFPILDRYYQLRYPSPKTLPGVSSGDWLPGVSSGDWLPGVSSGDWEIIKDIAEFIRAEFSPSLREVGDSQRSTKKGGRDIIRRPGVAAK